MNIKQLILDRDGDLSGMDLRNQSLIYEDFSYVNLFQADLSNADAIYSNFEGANLTDTKLIGTNLAYSNLREAKLIRSDLHSANLRNANLQNAMLDGSCLTNIQFGSAIGDMKYIKSLQIEDYCISYTATHLAIGNEIYKFTNDIIRLKPLNGVLLPSDYLNKWMDCIMNIIDMSPAAPSPLIADNGLASK